MAEHQVYAQGDAVRGGRSGRPIKLGQAETEGLIADDVLAGENGRQHERELTVGWHTERDDRDVGQRHEQRGIGVRARVRRQRFTSGQCVRVHIRYRDHLHPGHAEIGLDAEAPEGAKPHHPDAHRPPGVRLGAGVRASPPVATPTRLHPSRSSLLHHAPHHLFSLMSLPGRAL